MESSGSHEGFESGKKAIEPGKRALALLIDLIACYAVAMVFSLIPFLKTFISQQVVVVTLFMLRDYFFNGRGIGKNLMGLQVVDYLNGRAASLKQSLLRNITLTAPVIVLEAVTALPPALLPDIVREAFNILVAIYAIIVLPLESYRAYSREDSLRLGDVLAHTKVILSQTNFDHFLPQQKN